MVKSCVLLILLACILLNITSAYAFPKNNMRFGGERDVPVDDPNVKRLAAATLRKLRKQHQGDRALILVAIESATYQVVAGLKYHLHLKVGQSECAKDKYTERCSLDEQRPYLACGSKIWEKRWMHFMDVKVTCSNYD